MTNKLTDSKSITDQLRTQTLDWQLYEQAKNYALDYMQTVLDRPVFPTADAIKNLAVFREKLPDQPVDPYHVLEKHQQ